MHEGNFALLLFMATVVSGVYWVLEQWIFLPRRRSTAAALQAQETQRHQDLQRLGIDQVDVDLTQAREEVLRQPWWLDWTAGLFPVIVVVFILRSFLFEPFKIPSGSMIPTLWIGDLILVNKFHYGLRLPVLNTKITEGNPVQRGDVMVFRYPPKPSLDYIKRVIGVPGDNVVVNDGQVFVNGKALNEPYVPRDYRDHISTPAKPVPPGEYFVLGDHRSSSNDSRMWGTVKRSYIVGNVQLILWPMSQFGFPD